MLDVEFSEQAGEMARARALELPQIGADLRTTATEVYWENPFGFAVHVSDLGWWQVKMYHFDLLNSPPPPARYENYQRSMRWGIHYPLFSLLELGQGKQLAHASALGCRGVGYLLMGLNGVGKSTLATYLSLNKGLQLLADNYVLYDERFIYPFPERLRLSRASLDHLGLRREDGAVEVYGKYQLPIPAEIEPLRPGACFLVLRGPELTAKPLALEAVPSIKAALDDYLQEYPRYSYLGVWLALRGLARSLSSEGSSLWRCPWFVVRVPRTWELEPIAEVIEQCVSTCSG